MLTPIDIHYLVGLLSSVGLPDDVELELGSMVPDQAAGKDRDVDVTIRRRTPLGSQVFVGLEVKAEKRPLDLVAVEQLCQKLNDMKDLTSRAIVSASGYSDPARSKAEAHGIELLRLDPWDPESWGMGTAVPADLPVHRMVLTLDGRDVNFHIDWPVPSPPMVDGSWRVTEADGSAVTGAATLKELGARVCRQVAQSYFKDPKANRLGPGEAIAVVREVAYQHCPVVWNAGQSGVIRGARVSGLLGWKHDTVAPEFKILVRDRDESPFLACVVAEIGEGSLMALGIREQLAPLTLFTIAVSDRNKQKIHRERWPSSAV
jgi:hypothetical protein